MALPLAATLIPSAALGAVQLIRGANADVTRPVRETPESTKNAVAVARNLTNTGLPGQDVQLEGIKKNVANKISQVQRNAASGSDITAATTAAATSENDAVTRLGQRDAEFRTNANFGLIRALQNQAGQESQNFNFNEAQKFNEEAQRKSQLIGGGIQNINTSIQDAGTLSVMKKLNMLKIFDN